MFSTVQKVPQNTPAEPPKGSAEFWGVCKNLFSGRGGGQQLFSFQSPAVQ